MLCRLLVVTVWATFRVGVVVDLACVFRSRVGTLTATDLVHARNAAASAALTGGLLSRASDLLASTGNAGQGKSLAVLASLGLQCTPCGLGVVFYRRLLDAATLLGIGSVGGVSLLASAAVGGSASISVRRLRAEVVCRGDTLTKASVGSGRTLVFAGRAVSLILFLRDDASG